jgi:pilus assembly protein CpaB
MRILLVILAALFVAVGTGFYVFQGLGQQAPAAAVEVAAPKLREVFVPARQIAVGTIIAPEHLGRMEMTEGAITGQMIVADAMGEAFLAGSVARQVLPQGVPIARSAIVKPGDRGFLAAVLPQGKRAITIAISEVAGIGGLVLPGDRVDLILTYSVAGDLIDAEREIRASETMMTNIRVLALDQRLGPSMPDKEGGKVETPPIARTATLEVTPQQAEMVTLAQTLGNLSLVLNSVRDGGETKPDDGAIDKMAEVDLRAEGEAVGPLPRPMTLDSDVTSLLQRQPAPEADAAPAGPSPLQPSDRTTKVQVVRGVQTQAVQLGVEALAAAEPVSGDEPSPASAAE